ncbi:MAG: helix-turn-helix domain-containing protein [Nitrosomonas sp.]|uniref:helix-turn-helix transcriptional regulator n=1 Tax=Nitrosomonas sp. TaxID=42353 RepID=UPI0027317034|nr:helix-turn-helix domain-containing protein [Nitrosomonas sp.]MDP1550510.1 helix-turn-helix domain-containing protein [Nitrosomonas sp.]
MKQTLVTTQEAAEYIGGLKPNTLEGWRTQGIGPRYRKIGRLVRYSTDDLDAYLEAQTRHSTSQKEVAA